METNIEIEGTKESFIHRIKRKIRKYFNKNKTYNSIKVKLPIGYMNVGITSDNFLIADTNDTANWDTIKFPLPKPKYKWSTGYVGLNDNTVELYDEK